MEGGLAMDVIEETIEFGCDVFLTNDNQLPDFLDITVEELP
jgi:hypothetical protein